MKSVKNMWFFCWVLGLLSCGYAHARAPQRKIVTEEAVLGKSADESEDKALPEGDLYYIESIKVDQNKRISEESILSKLPYKENTSIGLTDIQTIIETLYKTELFAHVSAEVVEDVLWIQVRELPSVNSVSFTGNQNIESSALEKDLGVEERQILSKEQLRNTVERLSMIYRQAGYFHASVSAEVIYKEDNRVDVVFNIQEGTAAYIGDIFFFGNKAMKSSALQSIIVSKPYRWWRIMKSGSLFHAENVEIDEGLIEGYYLNRGYLDFKLSNATAQLSPLLERFTLTYHVHEGQPYTVKEVRFENDIPFTSIKKVPKWRNIPGDIYVHDDAQSDVLRLERAFARNGFPYVRVRQENVRDTKTREVVIIYKTYRIPKTVVRSVSIFGNRRTFDFVLYPLLDISEGDLLDERYIQSTQSNLRRTGFFESVSVEKTPTPGDPSGVNVRFVVKERNTGNAQLRLRYNQSSGIGLDGTLNDPNFWGHGSLLRINVLTGAHQWSVGCTVANPAFKDLNILAGLGVNVGRRHVFRPKTERKENGLYWLSNKTARTFFVVPFRRYWSTRYEYSLTAESFDVKEKRIYSVKKGQFQNVHERKYEKDVLGVSNWPDQVWVSRVRAGLVFDRRDCRFDATKGLLASFMLGVSGLGGDVKNWDISIDADYHHKLTDIVTLHVRAYLRYLRPWSDNHSTRVMDRHRMGGSRSVRGFREWGIGPKTMSGEDVGGDTMIGGTIEFLFPIGLPKESQFRGVLFLDAGSNWDSFAELDQFWFMNDRGLRVTAGLGIRWASPMGVIDIAYGIPLRSCFGDEIERMSFGMQSLSDAQDDFL